LVRASLAAGAEVDAIAWRIARNAYRRESFFAFLAFVAGLPMKGARWIVLTVLLALGVIGAGLAAWKGGWLSPPEAPAVGGPFQLTDQNGARVDQRVLKGKWSAVFFGFTYCPEACPTTLTTLAQAMDALGPRAKDMQVVFISVDPERDTPAALKTYLSSASFPKRIVGLTGGKADVAAAARAYHVYYKKSGEGSDYTVDHSTIIYLMDPKGRFNRVIAYGLTPDEVARQISEAMRGA
jgi:protein SCO1/2